MVAARLAEQGAGAIVLVGRGQPDGKAEDRNWSRLRERTTGSSRVGMSVADFGASAIAIGVKISTTLPPLRGVVHAAENLRR